MLGRIEGNIVLAYMFLRWYYPRWFYGVQGWCIARQHNAQLETSILTIRLKINRFKRYLNSFDELTMTGMPAQLLRYYLGDWCG